MNTLSFDLTKEYGKFKKLNATNGGPWHKRHMAVQYRSNFEAYKAARIPYSRNHDIAAHTIYGGPYCHDISAIFPDFDADVNDPASYDFGNTDEDIAICMEAGTKTFFRLGQTIENQITKHNVFPPKDFKKWAQICEHIIMHYNEGWADGYHYAFDYWEIWNEPDLDVEETPCEKKRTWGGSKEQFFDFYATAAKYLKSKFPELKFGGPALAFRNEWADEFLRTMRERNVPIDFFSWHIYSSVPENISRRAENIQELLCRHGYGNAENICNEWNYIKGWTDEFVYSVKQHLNVKGAAFVISCMSVAQKSPLDMLMYYDTRPSVYNGLFDFYTAEPIKGYYSFYWYGMFYDMRAEVRAVNEIKDIYSLCGVDEKGKVLALITHYSDNDDKESVMLSVDFGKTGNYEIYLLDKEHDGELIGTAADLVFEMPVHSSILIKEI